MVCNNAIFVIFLRVKSVNGGLNLDKEKIDRISELTRISRERKLTDAEQEERQRLRAEYLEAIRTNFRGTLDSIKFTEGKDNLC